MTIYGSEIAFAVPTNVDYIDFTDAFDVALESLTVQLGFYSVDAIVNKHEASVLVGVNVPANLEAASFYESMINEHVVPALLSAGVEVGSIHQVEQKVSVFA